MRSEERVQSLVRSFVDECQEDFVGLWAILWEVKRKFPSLKPGEAKMTSLEIVRRMLATGTVSVGDFDSQKRFVAFPDSMSDQALLAELDSRWIALGREPDIGEVAWLSRSVPRAT